LAAIPSRALAVVAAISALAPAGLAPGRAEAQAPASATAQMRDAGGRLVATAEFREDRGDVLLNLSFATLEPPLTGGHALYIHEVGRCDAPDFATAGGIFNPTGRPHGRRNPDGTEAGDLPNVRLGPDGTTGYKAYVAPAVTLSPGPGSLLGKSGTALVLYAREDDGKTPPYGNSGARIACGVIVATNGASPSAGPVLPLVVGVILVAAGLALRRRRRDP
jgi:Cu-Zn family superoxide dismutase